MRPLTKPYTLFPNPLRLHCIAPRLRRRFATIGRARAANNDARCAGGPARRPPLATSTLASRGRPPLATSTLASLHASGVSLRLAAALESQNLAGFRPKRGVVAGRLHLREGHMARPAAK